MGIIKVFFVFLSHLPLARQSARGKYAISLIIFKIHLKMKYTLSLAFIVEQNRIVSSIKEQIMALVERINNSSLSRSKSNMNTKFLRFVFALSLALSALGTSTSVALADQPDKYVLVVSDSYTVPDICAFPITVNLTATITAIHYFDESGALIRIYNHVEEQDTFTANGKTLVGTPFTFNIEAPFDSDGNITAIDANGIIEKVLLPDGSLFLSAGRIDFLAHQDVVFFISPDNGRTGNIDGFCAALSQ